MSAYIIDWLNLLLRWGHLITGIAWIGASFYFVWLDNSLEEPSDDNKKRGFGGQLSSVHAGGFYEVGKYSLAPKAIPDTLHWFKWEAYSTWITGFLLFTLMYYIGAHAYLIDPSKMALSSGQAIAISLATLVSGWVIYDLLCKSPLAKNGWALAAVLLALITLASWALEQLFSDRAAYIHIGAIIGTCMAANVFFVIMPGQRAMVAAVKAGQSPDPKYAQASKLRSIHNNYLTLPILFLMTSNHYPMTYAHPQAWAVLLAILLIGAWTRHFFNLRHKGIVKPSILVTSAIALIVLAALIAPKPVKRPPAVSNNPILNNVPVPSDSLPDSMPVPTPAPTPAAPSDDDALALVHKHCTSCHSAAATDTMFSIAPGGVMFDTIEQIKQWAPRILARSVTNHDMPFMNKTGMTDDERATLGQWIDAL